MKKLLRAELFSPEYFLLRAAALVVLFLIVHLAGLREYTAFLSGTAAAPEIGMRWSSFYGMVYILCYLGFVVLAPILVIASGLVALWRKYSRSAEAMP